MKKIQKIFDIIIFLPIAILFIFFVMVFLYPIERIGYFLNKILDDTK